MLARRDQIVQLLKAAVGDISSIDVHSEHYVALMSTLTETILQDDNHYKIIDEACQIFITTSKLTQRAQQYLVATLIRQREFVLATTLLNAGAHSPNIGSGAILAFTNLALKPSECFALLVRNPIDLFLTLRHTMDADRCDENNCTLLHALITQFNEIAIEDALTNLACLFTRPELDLTVRSADRNETAGELLIRMCAGRSEFAQYLLPAFLNRLNKTTAPQLYSFNKDFKNFLHLAAETPTTHGFNCLEIICEHAKRLNLDLDIYTGDGRYSVLECALSTKNIIGACALLKAGVFISSQAVDIAANIIATEKAKTANRLSDETLKVLDELNSELHEAFTQKQSPKRMKLNPSLESSFPLFSYLNPPSTPASTSPASATAPTPFKT